jgi:di/tricarboxylate transporter
MIPLGAAMQSTGTADLFGSELARLTDGYAPLIALLVMFWAASLLTQVMSDAATVALLGPVAIALAADLGLAPEPFVVCTALGAVASFLTPLGHHGNLLILGPGRYTFGEFLRVGVPLTILIGFVCAWLAQSLWLGGPLWPTREALASLGLS